MSLIYPEKELATMIIRYTTRELEQLLANYQNKTQGITAIIGQRENDGIDEYKVRWGGKYCRVTFDTWVPKEKLGCPELIKNFLP